MEIKNLKLRNCALGVSTALTGLFAGAMLFIALGLVPYWASLAPKDFHMWFSHHANHIGHFMVPLAMATTAITFVCALLNSTRNNPSRVANVVGTLSVILIYVVYLFGNAPINEAFFGTEALTEGDISRLLREWILFHWIRVVLGLTSFAAFLVAFRRAE